MEGPRRPASKLCVVWPTGRGWQVLIVGAGSLAAGLSLGTTQFYQLAYALIGLFPVAIALGLVGSRALSLRRRMPHGEGLSAGGSANVGLRLTNGSRLAAYGVEVVDRLPQRNVYRSQTVTGGGDKVIEATVSFVRRGLYTIGPAEIATTDPFGLLRFRCDAGQRTEVLVYPEVHGLAGLPARGVEEAGGRARPKSQGEELSGLRGYRPGDDRRFIHWKSLARTGELFVKEFDPDAPKRYSVVLDLHAARAERDLEDSVSAAASVVSYLHRSGLAYRLRLTGRAAASTSFGTGDVSYGAAMRLLATAEADGETGIDEALNEEAAEGRLGEGVVLIWRGSPSADSREALAGTIRELSSRGISVVAVLVASHTYEPRGGSGDQDREARFAELARETEASGAAVRVLRWETGVAGLSPAPRAREAV